MQPNQDKLWWLALDHLQAEWPAKLEALLKNGQLAKHLDEAVEQTWTLREELQRKNPQLQEAELDEMTLPYFIAPPNPNLDRDNPPQLNPQLLPLLNQFKSQHGQSQKSPAPSTPTPRTMSSPKPMSSRRPVKSRSSKRTSKR